MGNSNSTINSNLLSKNELEHIQNYFSNNFQKDDKTNRLEKINKALFIDLQDNYQINLEEYMNKAYQYEFKQTLKNFDLKSFTLFCEFLLKSTESEDAFLAKIYQSCSYLYILYDIIQSCPGNFRSTSIRKEIIDNIIDYAIRIYIDLQDECIKKGVSIRYDKNNMKKYVNSLIGSKDNNFNQIDIIDSSTLNLFINENLISFDCLIRDYLCRNILENNKINIYSSNALPAFQLGVSNILSTEEFFFFCMSNPYITNKKYAYKLYCCNEMGFNISSVIYSFLGFNGPVGIFISHLTKENSKITLGMFLNSNFKECFENYVGDDCCFPFEVSPKLEFFRVDPYSLNKNKTLYISSKNHKNTNMKPGIGLGYGYSGSKIWLDMNDPFKESYFVKNETVYHEGSPFDNQKEYLNVIFFYVLINHLIFLFYF